MYIKFNLPVDTELVSTNEMYTPLPCKGGKGAYKTKSAALRKFQEEMERILTEVISDNEVSALKSELENPKKVVFLSIKYGFDASKFFKEDSSNYIKAIEDCISNRLGVDDSRNCKVMVRKDLSDTNTSTVEIETYELEYELPEGKKWKAYRAPKR